MKNLVAFLEPFFAKKSQRILFYSDKLTKEKLEVNSQFFYSNSLHSTTSLLKKYLIDLIIFDYSNSDKRDTLTDFSQYKKQNVHTKLLMLSENTNFDTIFYAYQKNIDLFIPASNVNFYYFLSAVELLLKNYSRVIISQHDEVQKLYELARFYATHLHTDVLITGENGTGKGIIAKAIHQLGRYSGDFIVQNCAGIPDTLFESEMFGYIPGAFTGASNKGKIGVMEKADKGILFLDEIGDLPLNQQAKLLRSIQRKLILRVGSSIEKKIDVRFLYATNKILSQEVLSHHFREDFYYRLKGAEINIPPLRKTPEDIEIMIAIFTNRFFKEQYKLDQIPSIKIDFNSLDQLKNYYFPGNMRELQKIVYQSLINMLIRGDNTLILQRPISEKPRLAKEKVNVETFWQIIQFLESNLIRYGGLQDSIKLPVLNHLRTKYNDNREKISKILSFKDKQSLANEIYRLGRNKD